METNFPGRTTGGSCEKRMVDYFRRTKSCALGGARGFKSVVDDNRELFVPETQETIKPHKNFMLFATQNPPGVYAGRKVLSRAFQNRFLELHVVIFQMMN